MAVPCMEIRGRKLAADRPTYVIAEIGVNHNGDMDIAHRMIDEARKAGADAAKFQTFLTEDVMISTAEKAEYQKRASGSGTQQDMVRKLELTFDDFIKLRDHCDAVGIDFLTTAFDTKSLDFVISLEPACLKWPSGEINNLSLLRQAARSGIPVLLSTGMASMKEIALAQETLEPTTQTAILQCVSNYPAQIEDQNLMVLPALQSTFGRPVGFSDHTIGPYAAIAARALGMCVLEKHMTLDRTMDGPDHAASTEPDAFAELVSALRSIEIGLGDGVKRSLETEQEVKAVARKSLVYNSDLPEGHVLTEADCIAKRPADGLSPDLIDWVVGMRLERSVAKDEKIRLEQLAG